ncbi:unnamed protein product [Gordionus sp. m RMFG-2023]
MVISGSINTLSTKWADITISPGYSSKPHLFNHPLIQTAGMFFGEILCLIAFKIVNCIKLRHNNENLPLLELNQRDLNSFSPFIFFPPCLCDMIATSLMYFALVLTYASSFQMLRGAVIIFTGLMSVTFLNSYLSPIKWFGIFIIIAGLTLVGLSDLLFVDNNQSFNIGYKPFDRNGVIAGDLLIILAQIIVACQVTYEERVITKYNISPLQAVGWEGVFGFLMLSVIIFIMNFVPLSYFSSSTNPYIMVEDVRDAFYQIKNSWILTLAMLGNILSIAIFNFAGVSITKNMNATTRMVLDSFRSLLIWVVSLGISWQKFHYLQLIGFLVLIIGMIIYEKLYTHIIRPFHILIVDTN